MRVGIVTTSFPRWAGDGRAPFVLEAARALCRRGLDVRVLAMHSPGARIWEVIDDIPVYRPRYLWPERLEVLQSEVGGLPVVWQRRPWARLALLPFLCRHTTAIADWAQRCDVIHANWTLSGLAAVLAQPVHRRPIVVTVQGSDIYQAAQLPGTRLVTQFALRRAACVLALSESLQAATRALGIPADHVRVMPNGVDVSAFTPGLPERGLTVLFVGSLIQRKGIHHLLCAWPAVLARCPGSVLWLVGEGPERRALMELAGSLGIVSQVRFVGAQSPEQIRVWMQRAAVFVLPSVEEGQGVVLLEALASATPCVASHVGGIPDVVTPDVGILVPPANPPALAAALEALLVDPARWRALSQAARRRAETTYDWSILASRITAVYAAVTARN